MKTFSRFLVMLALLLNILFLNASRANSAYAATIPVGCDVTELIDALNAANGTPDADTLELAADCVYTLTAVENETDGPNCLPLITTDITLHGNGATLTRASAPETPSCRFFNVTETGALTIEQLTLSKGFPGYYEIGGFFYGYSGGAIKNAGATLTIRNSVLSGNLVANYDFGGRGGAILTEGDVLIQDTLFKRNEATDGGALYHHDGTLTLHNSIFRKNTASSGGALFANGTTLITTSLFGNNKTDTGDGALSGRGGAITTASEFTLQDSTVRGNTSALGGGLVTYGNARIVRSTFAKNKGASGGAVNNFGALVIANSTFAMNHASNSGGAVYSRGTLKLRNDTFAFNRATLAGGPLYHPTNNANPLTLVANTIFVNGTPQNCVGNILDRNGNLRFPNADNSCIGAFGDPRLGKLQNNGGPTATMALSPGSAAINLGNVEVCTKGLVNNRDQRGTKRVRAGETACDSGAYEVE